MDVEAVRRRAAQMREETAEAGRRLAAVRARDEALRSRMRPLWTAQPRRAARRRRGHLVF